MVIFNSYCMLVYQRVSHPDPACDLRCLMVSMIWMISMPKMRIATSPCSACLWWYHQWWSLSKPLLQCYMCLHVSTIAFKPQTNGPDNFLRYNWNAPIRRHWIHSGSRASCSERLCPVHEVHKVPWPRAMSAKSLHAGPGRKQMSKHTSSSSSIPSLPPLSITMQQIYSRRWTSEAKRYLHVHKQQRCSGKIGVFLFCCLFQTSQRHDSCRILHTTNYQSHWCKPPGTLVDLKWNEHVVGGFELLVSSPEYILNISQYVGMYLLIFQECC